jgi:hypothetical protein
MTTNQADESHNTGDEPQDERKRVKSNGKDPWWPVWKADLVSDHCVRQLSMAAFGLWMRILLDMALDGESGEISGTAEKLARSYGIRVSEFSEWAVEIGVSGTGDVITKNNKHTFVINKTSDQSEWQIDNKTFFIIRNRRMLRERRKELATSEKRAEAGRKGMAKRWSADNKPIAKSRAGQNSKTVTNPLYLSSNSISQSDSDAGSENSEEKALDL